MEGQIGIGQMLGGLFDSCGEPVQIYNQEVKDMKYKSGEIVLKKGTDIEYKVDGCNQSQWNGTGQQEAQYWCRKKCKTGNWSKNYTYIFESDLEHASKEQRIKSLKGRKIEIEKEIKDIDKKIDFFENYEDEEDYLAHKIIAIMEKKGDKDSVKEILKEMKKTKIL